MTLSVSILHPRSIVHSSLRFSQSGPGLQTASSVALKRKAPTNTVSIGVFPLPPYKRILAHLRWKAGSSKHVPMVAGVASSQGKVWEVDSQAEEEV